MSNNSKKEIQSVEPDDKCASKKSLLKGADSRQGQSRIDHKPISSHRQFNHQHGKSNASQPKEGRLFDKPAFNRAPQRRAEGSHSSQTWSKPHRIAADEPRPVIKKVFTSTGLQQVTLIEMLNPKPTLFTQHCDALISMLDDPLSDYLFLNCLRCFIDREPPADDPSCDVVGRLLSTTRRWLQVHGPDLCNHIKNGDETARIAFMEVVQCMMHRVEPEQTFLTAVAAVCRSFVEDANANVRTVANKVLTEVKPFLMVNHSAPISRREGVYSNRYAVPDYSTTMNVDDTPQNPHVYPSTAALMNVFPCNEAPTDLKAYNGIVVDRPIPLAEGPLHLRELFMLTRADYAYGVEEAIAILRRIFTPVKDKVLIRARNGDHPVCSLATGSAITSAVCEGTSAKLRSWCFAALREADPHKQCKLYTKLRLMSPTIKRQYPDSLVLDLSLDTTQFGDPTVLLRGKRLMHGNLLVLSQTWFVDPHEELLFGVIHKEMEDEAKHMNTKRVRAHSEHSNRFMPISIVLNTTSRRAQDILSLLQSSATIIFQAIESQAFFTPYHRVLESLKDIALNENSQMPLGHALLMGETSEVPQYLVAAGSMKVGDALLMRDSSSTTRGMYNVDKRNLSSLLEPWTVELESKLSSKSSAGACATQHVLDITQAKALEHIFSHKVAIVQGTPGTGKTFIGGKVVQILLENSVPNNQMFSLSSTFSITPKRRIDCGSILLIAQTNHAIDAVLEDVLPHIDQTDRFALTRLGNRSSNDRIAPFSFSRLVKEHWPNRQRASTAQNVYRLHEDFSEARDWIRYYTKLSNGLAEANSSFIDDLVSTCSQYGYVAWSKDKRLSLKNEMAARGKQIISLKAEILKTHHGGLNLGDINRELARWKVFRATLPALLDEAQALLLAATATLSSFNEDDDGDGEGGAKETLKTTNFNLRFPSVALFGNQPSVENCIASARDVIALLSTLLKKVSHEHQAAEDEKKAIEQRMSEISAMTADPEPSQPKKRKNKKKKNKDPQVHESSLVPQETSPANKSNDDNEYLTKCLDVTISGLASTELQLTTLNEHLEGLKRLTSQIEKGKPKLSEAQLNEHLELFQEEKNGKRKLATLEQEQRDSAAKLASVDPRTWRTALGPLQPNRQMEIRDWVFSHIFGARSVTTRKPIYSDDNSTADSSEDDYVEEGVSTHMDNLETAAADLRRGAECDRFDEDSDGDRDQPSDETFEKLLPSAEKANEACRDLLKELTAIPEDSSEIREKIFQCVCAEKVLKCLERIRSVLSSLAINSAQLRRDDDDHRARFLRNFKIIGATTSGCASMLSVMRKVQPKVVIVEEAAEVLESHIIACLSQGVEHLILIGDHKQLQPKTQQEMLLGVRKHLSVSLMERLVRLGAPYVTLTTQRRMHPEISAFHKTYYLDADVERNELPASVEDHPRTSMIPLPLGVEGNARVLLVGHDGLGQHSERYDEGMQSFDNPYESQLALAIFLHLKRANPMCSITIIVPYSAHTLHTLRHANEYGIPKRTALNTNGVRIASIDDYQGEEDDFVIICLTRTTIEGFSKGFLRQRNRVCVALSRAKRGMYVVACLTALQGAENPLWKEFLQILGTKGCPTNMRYISEKFPACCPKHQVALPFGSFDEYRRSTCSIMCSEELSCGHMCQKLCHFGLSNHGQCMKACERVGSMCSPPRHCSHPCDRSCRDNCGPCAVSVLRECRTCGSQSMYPCHGIVDKVNSCNTIKSDVASCGHTVSASCRQWVEGTAHLSCKERCNEAMSCSHICQKKCHFGKDCDHSIGVKKCNEMKTIANPRCNVEAHTVTIVCNTPLKDAPRCCMGCVGTAPCGHTCQNECGLCKEHVCRRPTLRSLSCGHDMLVPCNIQKDPPCSTPCAFVHSCGHQCPGSCGACGSGGFAFDHQPCNQSCGKILMCGHMCNGTCDHAVCPPCQEGCNFECGHGGSHLARGNKKGHSCTSCDLWKCQNACDWRCEHQTCELRCFQPCIRPKCNEPCSLPQHALPCGHTNSFCVGVCGEMCPSFCSQCFADEGLAYDGYKRFETLSILLRDEDEKMCCLKGDFSFLSSDENEVEASCFRIVEMKCCKKFMLSGELDIWIENSENDTSHYTPVSGPYVCPLCDAPLFPHFYRRQGALVKQRWSDVRTIVKETQKRVRQYQAELEKNSGADIMLRSAFQHILGCNASLQLQKFNASLRRQKPLAPSITRTQCSKGERRKAKHEHEELLRQYTLKCEEIKNDQQSSKDALNSLIDDSTSLCNGQVKRALQTSVNVFASFIQQLACPADSQAIAHSLSDLRASVNFAYCVSLISKCRGMICGDIRNIVASFENSVEGLEPHLAIAYLWLELTLIAEKEANVKLQNNGGLSHIERRFSVNSNGVDPLSKFVSALQHGAKTFLDSHTPFFRGKGHTAFIPNPCLTACCSSFQRFCNGLEANQLILPPNRSAAVGSLDQLLATKQVFFAFHGTSSAAIDSICCCGFDVTKRAGQSYGPGEYFGNDPKTSDDYTKGSEALIVCAVLSVAGAVTKHPTFTVVNNPTTRKEIAYVVPLGIQSWSVNRTRRHTCSYPRPSDNIATCLADMESALKWITSWNGNFKSIHASLLKAVAVIIEHYASFSGLDKVLLGRLNHVLAPFSPSTSLAGDAVTMEWFRCSARGHLFQSAKKRGLQCPDCVDEAEGTSSTATDEDSDLEELVN